MASINGIGGYNDYSSMSGVRGFGGLASGLDRDSLIEQMLYGTTSKINKQMQKKTALQWQQTAIRSITDKMVAFANKYTATMTSSSNLFNANLWGKTKVSALGENSKFVSVSGMSNTADNISILGVKQLAAKAKLTSSDAVSDQVLQTGALDLTTKDVSDLIGKDITFKYGGDSGKLYTISLREGEYEVEKKDADGNTIKDAQGNPVMEKKEYKYDTAQDVVDSINALLEKEALSGSDKKLSEVVQAELDGDKVVFKNKSGNALSLHSGSALKLLGYEKSEDQAKDAWNISASGLKADKDISLTKTEYTFADRIGGKKLNFTYNGVTKSIELPGKEELKAAADDDARVKLVEEALNKGLSEAFGENRIKVTKNMDNSFSFETIRGYDVDGTVIADKGSTLVLAGGDSGLMGEKGVFNVNYGESNRVNLNAKLSESGLGKNFSGTEIYVNDTKIEIKAEDTVADIMKRIEKEANVTVSYQSLGDKFTFSAKEEGASGKVKLDAAAADLFGITGKTEETGKDAEIVVKYADSDDEITLYRSSNTFNLEGLNISVNGTFGYNPDGSKVEGSQAVTFDAKADTDKAVDTIKKMVEEYNEIIELINKEVSTRPDRQYGPLTAEQKKELSEDEVKNYEEKAKEGLLFGDSDLRGLSRELRYVISSLDQEELRKIGISTSSSYSDNGKLEFDESKFRAALESDPQKVKKLFTKEGGIADNMRNVLDKYAKTTGATKGILIEKAGSVKSPLSITNNAIYKQLNAIDKIIKQLEARKSAEEDRYIKQFTSLESLISQMNSQSSMFSQFGGY